MKITIGLILASLATLAAASSGDNKASSLSARHLGKDDYAVSARMHRQRRAARNARRAANSSKEKRELKALLAAKMVAKKAKRAAPSSGTTATQPDNLAQGTATSAEGCTLWHTVQPGEVCLGVIDKSEGLTLEDFFGLNPQVGQQCQDLQVGLAYCIDTDHLDPESIKNASSKKTCKPKAKSSSDSTTSSTLKNAATKGQSGGNTNNSDNDKSNSDHVPIAVKPSAQPKDNDDSETAGHTTDDTGFFTNGVINFAKIQSSCGNANPQAKSDETTGPNGSIEWLNCGINKNDPSSKWNPPKIGIHEVVVKELTDDGIFAPCKPYFPLFHKYAQEFDIPAIFIASFAMQESTCNKDAMGDNGGAFGLMQITADKCTNGISCSDPDYNIRTGAKYFRDTLDSMGGDLLRALGQYNGWSNGLSYAQATAAAFGDCCVCQNNLDYLHQFLNGWANGVSAYDMKPWNNLQVCGGSQAGNSKRSTQAPRSVAGNRFMAKWYASRS